MAILTAKWLYSKLAPAKTIQEV